MSDLSNLVDERDDIFLQHLGANLEVVHETEAKNGIDLLARHHGIHVAALGNVLSNDRRASLTET